MDRAIVHFINKNFSTDIEIPLDITGNELIIALNEAYRLGINTDNMKECYLKCEDPIVLIKGIKTLEEYGIRTGSILRYE